jgi:hypothetical protein
MRDVHVGSRGVEKLIFLRDLGIAWITIWVIFWQLFINLLFERRDWKVGKGWDCSLRTFEANFLQLIQISCKYCWYIVNWIIDELFSLHTRAVINSLLDQSWTLFMVFCSSLLSLVILLDWKFATLRLLKSLLLELLNVNSHYILFHSYCCWIEQEIEIHNSYI